MEPEQLADFLTAILDRTVDVFEENDVDLPPDRRITTGTVPWDDALLAVALAGVKSSTAPAVPNSLLTCAATSSVSIDITLLRCASPAKDCEAAEALVRITDAWMLQAALLQDAFAGTFFPSGCTHVQWYGVQPLGPMGNLAGNKLSFAVQLDPK